MAQTYVEHGRIGGKGGRASAARVGAMAAVLAMALIVYGTYGDSRASDSQRSRLGRLQQPDRNAAVYLREDRAQPRLKHLREASRRRPGAAIVRAREAGLGIHPPYDR